mgnify:CR=1 FL=1
MKSNALQYAATGAQSLQALNDSGERPTLGWANRQASRCGSDRAAGATLSWQGGLMRPAGAPKRDLDREIVELHTEWTGGLAVKTRRGANMKFAFTDTGSKKIPKPCRRRLYGAAHPAGRRTGVERAVRSRQGVHVELCPTCRRATFPPST